MDNTMTHSEIIQEMRDFPTQFSFAWENVRGYVELLEAAHAREVSHLVVCRATLRKIIEWCDGDPSHSSRELLDMARKALEEAYE